MSLRRTGFTTFAAGLFVGTVLLVLGPVESSTTVSCPGFEPPWTYAVSDVQVWPPLVTYSDGCNRIVADPTFAVAYLLALVGLAVAAAGYGLERRRRSG